jgi:hypothetical protein
MLTMHKKVDRKRLESLPACCTQHTHDRKHLEDYSCCLIQSLNIKCRLYYVCSRNTRSCRGRCQTVTDHGARRQCRRRGEREKVSPQAMQHASCLD